MKFSREGHKIIIEIEPVDCLKDKTLEMTADAVLQGMLLGYRNPEIEEAVVNTNTYRNNKEKLEQDFIERWEL